MTKIILLALLVLAVLAVRPAINYLSQKKARTGLVENRFVECPDSPNCVSSMASNESHKVSPIPAGEKPEVLMQKLASIIRQEPGTRILVSTKDYLHAVYKTKLLGFTDDLELLLLPQSDVIEVKSSSRLGHSDFGVNRNRVERLRSKISQ